MKANFKMINNDHAGLIYSSVDDKFYLNLIVAKEKGKGYGGKLLDVFKEIISADFYIETWLYDGNTGLIKWIEKNDGEVVRVVENFWLKDSIEENYSCSICGHPCKCIMTLYYVKNSRKK